MRKYRRDCTLVSLSAEKKLHNFDFSESFLGDSIGIFGENCHIGDFSRFQRTAVLFVKCGEVPVVGAHSQGVFYGQRFFGAGVVAGFVHPVNGVGRCAGRVRARRKPYTVFGESLNRI